MKHFYLLIVALLLGCGTEGPPEILDITRLQNTTSELGPYGVYATVVDDTKVTQVELRYRVSDDDWVILNMANISGDVYYAEIPGQSVGSRIWYFVAATDGETSPENIPQLPLPEDQPDHFFDVVAPAPTHS